jgi:chemotaxis protein CheD
VIKVIDTAGFYVSQDTDDIITTNTLGSCIAIALYDQVEKIGGVVRCKLPLSKIDPDKAVNSPCLFTDTGLTFLLQELFDRGASRGNIKVILAGCASLQDEKGFFKVGERNYAVARKVLLKNNLSIKAEAVKGSISRTLTFYLETGKIIVKSGDKELEFE